MTYSKEQLQGLKNFDYVFKQATELAKVKGCTLVKDLTTKGINIFISVSIFFENNCVYTISNKELSKAVIGTYLASTLIYYMKDMPFVTEPKITFIYGLVDPDIPDEYRYIGKANSPEARLVAHIRGAKKLYVDKDKWIKLLLDSGKKPLVKVIEEVKYSYEIEWGQREIYHIDHFKKEGHRLTNIASGGHSYEGKGYNAYDELLDIWRKNPTIESEMNLKKMQKTVFELRIKYFDNSASICTYCGSFIPSIISDFFPENNCLYEEDILPYAPLLDQPSLWEGEIKKHDENCVWWRTGTIGMSSPIDDDTFLELHELREKKARKHEAFHFFLANGP